MSKFCDITPQFRSLVSDLESSLPPESVPERDKSRILKKRTRDPLEKRAHDIAQSIDQLRLFLTENRDAYLDINSGGLADYERDKIDNGANTYIRTCNGLIAQFKKDLAEKQDLPESRRLHLKAVCDILAAFLKSACDIFTEQKAIRVQREMEFQKMSRLEVKARQGNAEVSLEHLAEELSRKSDEKDNAEPSDDEAQSHKIDNLEELEEKANPKSTKYVPSSDDEEDEALSPEEEQMLQMENEKLYEDLQNVQDSVQQIENKVVKIAELQEVFTEKVLQQKDDIDLIAKNAVATTENVKDGNEELRKAIQNQASIRVYILFFLLVMSFSLLFLDWYND